MGRVVELFVPAKNRVEGQTEMKDGLLEQMGLVLGEKGNLLVYQTGELNKNQITLEAIVSPIHIRSETSSFASSIKVLHTLADEEKIGALDESCDEDNWGIYQMWIHRRFLRKMVICKSVRTKMNRKQFSVRILLLLTERT